MTRPQSTSLLTPHSLRSALLSGLLAAALAAGCAQPTPLPVPSLNVEGDHAVAVGETLALTTTTTDGDDSSYDWRSLLPTVATVDAEGVVTGVAPGELILVVKGADSGATTEHVVVVTETPTPPGLDGDDVPYFESWLTSSHADATAEAFRHWDEDGSVPTQCAQCHSQSGYADFLGDDGTAPGSVEAEGQIGSVVGCTTCHSPGADTLTSVTFPSGETVNRLGPEARCMVCHQGRASTDTVNEAIAEVAVGDDEVSEDLGFVNVHYYAAGATLYAGAARGGYQYDGLVYDERFRHAPGFNTCVGCHDAHSTTVKWTSCADCHQGVSDRASAENIRMIASLNQDYDGDGNTEEGIHGEVDTLRKDLLEAIQQYGAEQNLFLCYSADSYPYFFNDDDHDGVCSEEEASYGNRYTSFSPRLLKAAYNFQLATRDPGGFAHNAKYLIQLMVDGLNDLNEGVVVPLDLDDLVRTDTGHFNGAGEASRHWDEDAEVRASCAKCHAGAEGFRFYLETGGNQTAPETANGLDCATCHDEFEGEVEAIGVPSTTFPGGLVLELRGDDNLCSTCHSGRASKVTIDRAIDAAELTGDSLGFQNVHYLPAAGTLFGSEAGVGYEYADKVYAGLPEHEGGVQCTTCHDAQDSNHSFRIEDVWEARCDVCHGDAETPQEIRVTWLDDYDGDLNASDTLEGELEGMSEALLDALHANSGSPAICYSSASYPYFFKDNDGSGGHCDPGEAIYPNRFTSWTPAVLRAAHNYQLAHTEPGAWAHNFAYIAQLLFDSTEDLLGMPPPGLMRP